MRHAGAATAPCACAACRHHRARTSQHGKEGNGGLAHDVDGLNGSSGLPAGATSRSPARPLTGKHEPTLHGRLLGTAPCRSARGVRRVLCCAAVAAERPARLCGQEGGRTDSRRRRCCMRDAEDMRSRSDSTRPTTLRPCRSGRVTSAPAARSVLMTSTCR